MRIALITTPAGAPSGIGDYTRNLLPYLREHAEVRLFVHGDAGEDEARVDALDPREHDRILFQLGNERLHGFMPALVRRLGGTVVLHDWVLFDQAMSAYPELRKGGLRGHLRALREGGLGEARIYARSQRALRAQPRTALVAPEAARFASLEGPLLCGWHALEANGRWTADEALLRLPSDDVREVAAKVSSEPGRTVRIDAGGGTLASHVCSREQADARIRATLDGARRPLVRIATAPVDETEQQRRHRDRRRLGAFVSAVEWRDAAGWHAVDLSRAPSLPCAHVELADERFRLALNRTVVRGADGFVVHSDWVRRRIERLRPRAPIAVVPHGAERHWRLGEDRVATRDRLPLPRAWRDDFLLVSFGNVRPHKRIDQVHAGVALARRTHPDLRLVLVGGPTAGDGSLAELEHRFGLAGAVHVTGHLPQEEAWDWLHAADLVINLRGPTTGGTSGGIFQSLAFGRAVLATDAAEQSELPDACVVKIPLGDGEVEAIRDALVALRGDPARRAELEAAARAFVDEACHWSRAARGYVDFLARVPAPRSTRGD